MSGAEDATDDSPFHAGELDIQQRAGSRERLEGLGRRIVQDRMHGTQREFFSQQPFLVVGAPDARGQPWASLLCGGNAGFVQARDDAHLRVDARPHPEDPLAAMMMYGTSLGILGIDLHTRRRNRVNGWIVEADGGGFLLRITQSFGNCPKYIQRRARLAAALRYETGQAFRTQSLDAQAIAWVRGADTFFIATHAAAGQSVGGSDVSHRGGLPGFVQVSDEGRVLIWPDFAGNQYFNTLGNLMLDPRAGLVFVDFRTGGLLHVAGRAEVVWDGACVRSFQGAQRLVRLRIHEVVRRPCALPMRWELIEASPALLGTGVW